MATTKSKGTSWTIVIGADTHKSTHTCGAVFAASGQLAGEKKAAASTAGFRELLAGAESSTRSGSGRSRTAVTSRLARALPGRCRRAGGLRPAEADGAEPPRRARGRQVRSDRRPCLRARRPVRRSGEPAGGPFGPRCPLELELLLDRSEDLVRSRPRSSAACAGICMTLA